MNRALFGVFPYGWNIPGGVWFTRKKVQEALRPLAPGITFADIVDRPDSFLLWADSAATEDSLRRQVSEQVESGCVVVSIRSLTRLVSDALDTLKTSGLTVTFPYTLAIDGVEWEWCMVLCSERLPPSAHGSAWLYATDRAVAVAVVGRLGLLVRKVVSTPSGTRVMLGAALNEPFVSVLETHGVTVASYTSRRMSTLARVVERARSLSGA
jgi:hypothetical protein